MLPHTKTVHRDPKERSYVSQLHYEMESPDWIASESQDIANYLRLGSMRCLCDVLRRRRSGAVGFQPIRHRKEEQGRIARPKLRRHIS